MYISDPEELAAFCERISDEKVVAVDTEFLREKTYYPRLCLIQLGTSHETAAIDPILIDDLEPVKRIFCDERITKVFHACSQDLEVIWWAMGCVPSPIFDTQLAAAFLGHRMQMGYGALVESHCGTRLAKADSLSDWSVRPLDPEQLEYAEDDVRYLPAIYSDFVAELAGKDRLSWVAPEFEAMVSSCEQVRDPETAYLSLKRSSSLTRRQLAIARELCAWRERRAQERDIPKRWVMTDEVIVEICRAAPRDAARISRIRGTEQLSKKDVHAILEAVAEGKACPEEELPVRAIRPRPSADEESVLDLMHALVRRISERSGVAAPLIATRDDLHDLFLGSDDARLAMGWRKELAGEPLSKLLAGELGLTVKQGRIELL